MAGKPQIQLPPRETLQRMLHEKGCEKVARDLGMSASGLSYRAKSMGLTTAKGSAPGTEPVESTFTVEVPKGADLSPEKLLKRVGLDPEGWQVYSVKAREGTWGSPDKPNEQIRLEVQARPKLGGLKLPELEGWKPLPKPKPRKRKADEPSTSVIISDHHAPHEDRIFHQLFCQWLEDDQPDLIEVNGDLLDFADISRHRNMPSTGPGGPNAYVNTVNECLQAGFNILADYRKACPNATIRYKFGNHDYRLYNSLVDNLKNLYDITAADETIPALSLRKLLRLDELHVELLEEHWERGRTRIGTRLTTTHGQFTSNPGNKLLNKYTGSTLQGHSHRLSILYRTAHHHPDGTETRLAGETGCACLIDDGLGYADDPDWQQGAMLVKTWPDEDFTIAPLIYLPGRLLLPDGRRYVLPV